MRSKIFKYCTALILGSFLMLELTLNILINSYVTDNISARMNTAVSAVSSVIEDNMNVSVSSIASLVDYYGDVSSSFIIVFGEKGNVIAASGTALNYISGHQLPENITSKILSGKNVSVIDHFDGIFKSQVIVCGKPIKTKTDIVGGVLSVLPQPQLGMLKWEIHKYFLWGMMIAIMFAFIMAYIISRQVTKPIRKINDALKQLAVGEFKSDLKLEGDLKPLSDTFNEMATAIKNSDRVGKEFLANVSHELRTPMTTITGFLQGIEDGTIPTEKHHEYINLVINEMKRLTRLTNGLLEVARMDIRKEEFTTERFDINELIRVTLITFENRITEKEINVRIEFENEKLNVDANCDGITRVITNLIDNAIKFANRGGYILLKTSARGENATISIENSGVGIPENDLEFIFDRFHKSDKSRSMDKKGVGLGLYIVKNIIKQHGKQITAESEEGKYARFTFVLKKA